MSEKDITHERVKSLINYNPETGVLIRRISVGYRNCHKAGKRIGGISRDGYRYTGVDGYSFLEHRLVWFYMTGKWPTGIDHINHVKDDNRFVNLREATPAENSKNLKLSKLNKSGKHGVKWSKLLNKWLVQIVANGTNKHVGVFTDKSDAFVAREKAEAKYGYHKNHGR